MPKPNRSLIRAMRQTRGWKLGELAERAQIKMQHLANIESGYATASLEVLQRIADALNADTRDGGVDVGELIDDEATAGAA